MPASRVPVISQDGAHVQPGSRREPHPAATITWGIFLAIALANGVLLWSFHDVYWYPSDEGIYAHIADRLLQGEVLSRDVQSLHPGYINFVNAAAMWLFGHDLLSLRYPLALVALLQSCLIFRLFARRSVVLAAAASIAVTAFGTIQFLNPTAHWYCLFLSILLVWWMSVPVGQSSRLIGAGAIVGCIMLFRQLTGLWMLMALLVGVLWEQSSREARAGTWLARGILGIAWLLLLAYVVSTAGARPVAKVMVGTWPLAILGVVAFRLSVPNRATLHAVAQLSCGVALSALPLAGYLTAHAAWLPWMDDSFAAALRLTALEYMQSANWLSLAPVLGVIQVLQPRDAAAFLNGLYWAALPVLPIVNGVLTLRMIRRSEANQMWLPVTAAFYALVSLHLEGSMYWYFSVGLSMAACLWHAARARPSWQRLWTAGAVTLAAIAIVFHAGQSASRSASDRLLGVRTRTQTTRVCNGMPGASLRIEWSDCEPYRQVVALLESHVPPNATMLAIPSDAEFYFLAQRRNPFRFYNTALGIRNDAELRAVLDELARHPPMMVTFRPADKFNTAASAAIMQMVRARYRLTASIGGVEIYEK